MELIYRSSLSGVVIAKIAPLAMEIVAAIVTSGELRDTIAPEFTVTSGPKLMRETAVQLSISPE